jgi:hypothetical protein
MPYSIPLPEGLQIPKEPVFDLPVTFEMRDGELYTLAIDGIPLEGDAEEREMNESEMPEESEAAVQSEGGEMAAEGGNMDFLAAIERGLKNKK